MKFEPVKASICETLKVEASLQPGRKSSTSLRHGVADRPSLCVCVHVPRSQEGLGVDPLGSRLAVAEAPKLG